jgi:hypothetical protein
LPALCIINALFFHLPSLAARRPNPGVLNMLSVEIALGSVAIGALAMASAIVFLALHNRFAYPDVDAAGVAERH